MKEITQKIAEALEKSGDFPEMAIFPDIGIIELGSNLHIKVKDVSPNEPASESDDGSSTVAEEAATAEATS